MRVGPAALVLLGLGGALWAVFSEQEETGCPYLDGEAPARPSGGAVWAEGGSRLFHPDELAEFGSGEPLLLAIGGAVFDVTPEARLYGEDGGYAALAGRDATRAHARQTLDEADLTADVAGLTEEELAAAEARMRFFAGKYRRVGWLPGEYRARWDFVWGSLTTGSSSSSSSSYM